VEATSYRTEVLNAQTPPGMPEQHLQLKVGAIVILLRNMSNKLGMLNGTRMIIRECLPHVLKCELLTGSKKGTIQYLSRQSFSTENYFTPFNFTRRQFPVRLAFAMTINKAQVLFYTVLSLHYIALNTF